MLSAAYETVTPLKEPADDKSQPETVDVIGGWRSCVNWELVMEPLVSVCIPTRDRPDGLARTISCIQNQTYRNLEIIISDNASNDTRVREIVIEPLGMILALNTLDRRPILAHSPTLNCSSNVRVENISF